MNTTELNILKFVLNDNKKVAQMCVSNLHPQSVLKQSRRHSVKQTAAYTAIELSTVLYNKHKLNAVLLFSHLCFSYKT